MVWKELLGESIVTKDGVMDTEEILSGKKVVGLYFSAHWCPPCRQFTPFLSQTYEEVIEEHPEFEIVFVSSDQNAAAFEEYYREMPFKALPFIEREKKSMLSSNYQVEGIPMLIFLNESGELITDNGRMIVHSANGDVEKIWGQLTK